MASRLNTIVKTETIASEPSWSFHSDKVSAAVTCDGGHLGPVEFSLGKRVVRPFHVAPWAGEKASKELPTILRVLRGDFFCMPFGGNEKAWRGEKHPAHGETSNGRWSSPSVTVSNGWTMFRAEIETSHRPARVEKQILLRSGDTVVYSRHHVAGATGPMNFGHHAMLDFEEGPARISCSPFMRGQVFPGAFENPALGGYSALRPGSLFRKLEQVECKDGSKADLSIYPSREGFEDLVMVSSKPSSELGWSAAVFEKAGYVWFALKDPRVLASTVLWHSNGGRHYPPWNGRHRKVLGIEEVTSYFHLGLAESVASNPVAQAGIPTYLKLSKSRPLTVNLLMGVSEIPRGFDVVRAIRPSASGVLIGSASGETVNVPLDLGFLYSEEGR